MPNVSAAAWSKPRSSRNWRATIASAVAELLAVELLRDAVRLDQPAALRPAWSLGGRVAVLAPQLDAVLLAESLDRLDEA